MGHVFMHMEYVGISEAARLTGICERTFRRYISDGIISPRMEEGRYGAAYRLSMKDVECVRRVYEENMSSISMRSPEFYALIQERKSS